jgi:hypothetical protein
MDTVLLLGSIVRNATGSAGRSLAVGLMLCRRQLEVNLNFKLPDSESESVASASEHNLKASGAGSKST